MKDRININSWLSIEKSEFNEGHLDLHILDKTGNYEVGVYCFDLEKFLDSVEIVIPGYIANFLKLKNNVL